MNETESTSLLPFPDGPRAETPETREPTSEIVEASPELLEQVNRRIEQVWREQKEALTEASRAFAEIPPDAPTEVTEEAVSLFGRMTDAFRTFIKKSATISPVLAMLILQEGGIDPNAEKESGHRAGIERVFDGAVLVKDVAEIYARFSIYEARRIDGKMSPEEIEFKERIAQNIDPWEYDEESYLELLTTHGKTWEKVQQFKENSSDPKRSERNYASLELAEQVRTDLFRKYLGLRPYGSHLEAATERPTISTDPEAVYFSFNKREMLEDFKKMNPDIHSFDDFTEAIVSAQELYGEEFEGKDAEFLPASAFASQLGTYVVGRGFDEERKERYVSYYDLWNFDPPLLTKVGLELDSKNFPFEIYGRLYESDFKNW